MPERDARAKADYADANGYPSESALERARRWLARLLKDGQFAELTDADVDPPPAAAAPRKQQRGKPAKTARH